MTPELYSFWSMLLKLPKFANMLLDNIHRYSHVDRINILMSIWYFAKMAKENGHSLPIIIQHFINDIDPVLRATDTNIIRKIERWIQREAGEIGSESESD